MPLPMMVPKNKILMMDSIIMNNTLTSYYKNTAASLGCLLFIVYDINYMDDQIFYTPTMIETPLHSPRFL